MGQIEQRSMNNCLKWAIFLLIILLSASTSAQAETVPGVRCRIHLNNDTLSVKCNKPGLVSIRLNKSVNLLEFGNVTVSALGCGSKAALVALCSTSARVILENSRIENVEQDGKVAYAAFSVPEGVDKLESSIFRVPLDYLVAWMKARVGREVPDAPVAVAVSSSHSVAVVNMFSANVTNATALSISAAGDVLITNSQFRDNYDGSCVRVNASAVDSARILVADSNFTNCNSILGNYPIISVNQGGAMYINMTYSRNVTFQTAGTTTFQNCSASEGGALYVHGSNSTNATVRFTGRTTFRNNNAIGTATVGHGGACILKFGSEYYLALGYSGDHNMADMVAHDEAKYVNPTVSMEDHVLFESNTAMWEAGACLIRMAAAQNGVVRIAGNVTFRNNYARGHGGGLSIDFYSGNSFLNMTGALVDSNTAVEHAGGADINAMACKCAIFIADSTFTRNQAIRGAGGGMRLVLGMTQDIVHQANVQITRSIFSYNQAAGSTGGGLYLEGTSTLTFSCRDLAFWFDCDTAQDGVDRNLVYLLHVLDCLFDGNTATYGAGMLLYNTLARVQATTFRNNRAYVLGGAVFAKSMLRLTLTDNNIVGNSAGQQGGGIYSAISDGFTWHLIDIMQCNIQNNVASTQGGGVYLHGGITGIHSSNITHNNATLQGGGLAYADVCSRQSTCMLALHTAETSQYGTGNLIEDNSAFTGGGAFISTNPNNSAYELNSLLYVARRKVTLVSYNTTQLRSAVMNNDAVYAPDVSLPPTSISIKAAKFSAASSTGPMGLINLVADLGQGNVRALVDWCGGADQTGASLVGMAGKSDGLGAAVFRDLRLLNATSNQAYCLQVRTPDYPLITPTNFTVHIRDCEAGEFHDPGIGCTLCPPNQYSFNPTRGCSQCPRSANCTGGSVLIPNPGFWHDAPTTSLVQPCPNRAACNGNRTIMMQCRAGTVVDVNGTTTYAAAPGCGTPLEYANLQCSAGYKGQLCGSCDYAAGYGLRSFFRCGRCMNKVGSVAVLVLAAALTMCIVVFIALRALLEGRAMPYEPGMLGSPVNNEELYGSFKVLVLHLQFLGVVGNLLVEWPRMMVVLMRGIYFVFATSGPQVVSLDCLSISSNAVKMLLQLLLPLLAVGAAGGIISVLIRTRKTSIWMFATTTDALVVSCIIGVYLFYTQLTTTSLSAFSCMSYGSDSFWVRDMNVECWSVEHMRAALPLGILGTLLLCVAVPGATIYGLLKNWKNLNKTYFRARYAFLYRVYKEQYCYWEGVMCFYVIATVCVQLFVRRHGAFYQLILLVMLLVIMSTLVHSVRPYRSYRLHRLFLAGNLTLLLTCLGVMCMLRGYSLDGADNSSSLRITIALFIVILNCSFIALCLFVMARSMWVIVKTLSRAWKAQLRRQCDRLLPAPLRELYRKASARAKARAHGGLSAQYSVNSGSTGITPLSAAASTGTQFSLPSLPSNLSSLPELPFEQQLMTDYGPHARQESLGDGKADRSGSGSSQGLADNVDKQQAGDQEGA